MIASFIDILINVCLLCNTGQPHFTVKANSLRIYRSGESGKVFMAPGPLAMNQDMPVCILPVL